MLAATGFGDLISGQHGAAESTTMFCPLGTGSRARFDLSGHVGIVQQLGESLDSDVRGQTAKASGGYEPIVGCHHCPRNAVMRIAVIGDATALAFTWEFW